MQAHLQSFMPDSLGLDIAQPPTFLAGLTMAQMVFVAQVKTPCVSWHVHKHMNRPEADILLGHFCARSACHSSVNDLCPESLKADAIFTERVEFAA